MPGTTAIGRLDHRRFVKSLFSLRLAIALGIVLSARFSWLFSHAAKWDTPAPIPALILCELPMLFCVVALMNGEQSKRTLRAAGTAFGIALSFCIIWLPLAFDAGLTAWEDRAGYLAQLDQFLWPCLAFALWMLVTAWRCGKGQRLAFARSALMGVGSFVLTLVLINAASVTGSGEAKEKLRFQQVTQFPDVHIRAVAACLIRHHLLHPDEGFPSSLADIQQDWNCAAALSDPWALHKYWIYYSAVDRSPRGFQDFRIASIFPDDRSSRLSVVDKRGDVLNLVGAGLTGYERQRQHIPLQTVDADDILYRLLRVRDDITVYMSTHDPNNAPPSLDGLMDPRMLGNACEDTGNPQDRVIGRGYLCFKINYFPPSGTPPSTFAISLECVSYGDGCLRSFYLDYDGTIHGTTEPRPATNQDPGLLPCETKLTYAAACDDPVWSGSGRLSQWTFLRAKTLDFLRSAN